MTKVRALQLMRIYYQDCMDKPGRYMDKDAFRIQSNYRFTIMHIAREIVASDEKDPLKIIFSLSKQFNTLKKKAKTKEQIELYADMEDLSCNVLDFLEALDVDAYDCYWV